MSARVLRQSWRRWLSRKPAARWRMRGRRLTASGEVVVAADISTGRLVAPGRTAGRIRLHKMGSMRGWRVLLLYLAERPSALRMTTHQHLRALEQLPSPSRVLTYNAAAGAPAWLRRLRFDAVVLHTTFLCIRWYDRVEAERSEEHTSELQSLTNLVCRLLLEKKKINDHT